MSLQPLRLLPLTAAFFSLLFPALPCSAGLAGRVVSVHDGDTMTVLVERREVRVRLTEIDAPELGQPFGRRSKQSLAELCFGKTARVDVRSRDRYGRTVAQVTCAGHDANAEQVRRGYAWIYTRYAALDSPLHALEGEARVARRGLWAAPAPVPPWEWRRNGVNPTAPASAPSLQPLPCNDPQTDPRALCRRAHLGYHRLGS